MMRGAEPLRGSIVRRSRREFSIWENHVKPHEDGENLRKSIMLLEIINLENAEQTHPECAILLSESQDRSLLLPGSSLFRVLSVVARAAVTMPAKHANVITQRLQIEDLDFSVVGMRRIDEAVVFPLRQDRRNQQ